MAPRSTHAHPAAPTRALIDFARSDETQLELPGRPASARPAREIQVNALKAMKKREEQTKLIESRTRETLSRHLDCIRDLEEHAEMVVSSGPTPRAFARPGHMTPHASS